MGTNYDPYEYPPVLRDFAGYKAVIQNCSPRTVNEYMLDLRAFFRYLIARRNRIAFGTPEYEKISLQEIDITFLSRVTTSDIYEFMFFTERECKNAPAARARKLSAIKGLFKYYTSKRNLLEKNPAAEVETPKKRKSLPKYLTLDEARLLLDTVKNDTETCPAMRLRNYAMITIFLNCGIRLSELVGINLGDLDKYLRSVRVIGKGNKERVIYLNDACKNAVADYLPERNSEANRTLSTRALFISSRGKRISNRAVQWTVNKYLNMAGLGYRHFSVHKLRHTAATLMYQKGGVDVRVLKEILGHEQLNTTQIYTHVADNDIEKAMSKNPLANIDPRSSSSVSSGNDNDIMPASLADSESSTLPFSSMTGEASDVGREDMEPFEDDDDNDADYADDYNEVED